VDFGVLDDAVAIDDERGAFGDAAEAEIHLRQKGVVSHAVLLRNLVLVVAQERDVDPLLLRPGFLRERIVAADSINRAV